MSFRCTFTLSGLPRLQADTVHWRTRAKERKRWRDAVGWAIREAGIVPPSVPLAHARLTLTRHSALPPDPDNLAHSFKPIVDGLIGLVIVNDTLEVIGTPLTLWEKVKPKEGHITVQIEEVTETDTTCPHCGADRTP